MKKECPGGCNHLADDCRCPPTATKKPKERGPYVVNNVGGPHEMVVGPGGEYIYLPCYETTLAKLLNTAYLAGKRSRYNRRPRG